MISKKIKLTDRPIYNLFKQDKTVLSGSVRNEVRTSLICTDIALRKVYKAYEYTNRINEPTAQIVKAGIDGVADLEFFSAIVYDEIEALKDYVERLKDQNKQIRELNYELRLENQQLKL